MGFRNINILLSQHPTQHAGFIAPLLYYCVCVCVGDLCASGSTVRTIISRALTAVECLQEIIQHVDRLTDTASNMSIWIENIS